MPRRRIARLPALLALLAPSFAVAGAAPLAAAESLYADWLDATYAVATLAAGPDTRIAGRGADAWRALAARRGRELAARLPALAATALGPADRRAVAVMQRTLADAPSVPAAATGDESRAACARAPDAALGREALSHALYGCFEAYGNHIDFGGKVIVRTTALELLQELDSASERRALFRALEPLFRRINADDSPASPYRRLIGLAAAANAGAGGGQIAAAARTVGASTDEVEAWLMGVLDAWRVANPGPPLEPWDYWHHYAAGVHVLDAQIPPERILPLSKRYYRDLGADLDALGVRHDLAVRPGKAPLAYSDFVRTGRLVGGRWRPAIARVSANVEHGGLFVLNEIVHEDGHAVHASAVRTRPAFFAWGDDLFVEAFADVPSWSVAEPAWQQRYLGVSVDAPTALRALYGNVMLDVAWGLFELRMLRAPDADPNAVWSDITARYLNVVPHPELSWWALRVQLVDIPGYMINYGLGAILTADLREQLAAGAGDFSAGNPAWYGYASQALLRYGASLETPDLLHRFLGRNVSDAALKRALARIEPRAPAPVP